MTVSEEPLDAYIEQHVINEILQQCTDSLPLETIGFLVGEAFYWNYKAYCVVHGIATGETKSSKVHVEFAEGALGEVVQRLRSKFNQMMIVGWFHSHPGYGCFLSSVDIDTQSGYFIQPYHIALVVDPVHKSYGFFKTDETGSGYREVGAATVRRVQGQANC